MTGVALGLDNDPDSIRRIGGTDDLPWNRAVIQPDHQSNRSDRGPVA